MDGEVLKPTKREFPIREHSLGRQYAVLDCTLYGFTSLFGPPPVVARLGGEDIL